MTFLFKFSPSTDLGFQFSWRKVIITSLQHPNLHQEMKSGLFSFYLVLILQRTLAVLRSVEASIFQIKTEVCPFDANQSFARMHLETGQLRKSTATVLTVFEALRLQVRPSSLAFQMGVENQTQEIKLLLAPPFRPLLPLPPYCIAYAGKKNPRIELVSLPIWVGLHSNDF